jgi:hypothetical protein
MNIFGGSNITKTKKRSKILLKNLTFVQLGKIFPETATGLHPEPDKFSSHHPTPIL